MPAGAALSSSTRRKRSNLAGRGGLGRGLSGDNRASQRNIMMGASQRNLVGGSQRNLLRQHTGSIWEGENLHDSMPVLTEGREDRLQEIRGCLDDSVKTNPELFLTQRRKSLDNSSSSVELHHRKNPQNFERGESPGLESGGRENNDNGRSGESTPTRDKHNMQKRTSLQNRDSFNENNAIQSTTPSGENIPLPWFLGLCNDARLVIGKVVNDSRVQNAVLILIIANAIMMGVATFPSVKGNPVILQKLEICDQIFLIIFSVESVMQLIYHGWNLFKDGFLVFDLLIVVMSWALEGAQVFRAFRIFRTIRLITRIDTLKNLVLALFSVVPKMTAIFMLLMLIFYIFAVMFTQLFKGMFEEELVEQPYFETMFNSFFTLFQMMTLDEWAEILLQIQVIYSWAWVPFVVFISITAFVVMNLIIAVICDAVHVLGAEGKSGLHGNESDDYPSASKDENLYVDDEYPASTTDQRIEQLQQQLDEMVTVQEQMKSTIEILVKKLHYNASREAEAPSAQTDSREKYLRIRKSPTNSLGGVGDVPLDWQVSCSRIRGHVHPTFQGNARGRTCGTAIL
eukprot:CAMPEP_0181078910 /NCGR_PEP_ID=MMETSP1071-20121207/1740_1 /TAXON_ID=35127 /ORGANISM="Thalassiosira sp., Strain NH16" /LENGTH=569 /DNA_ID=CAMNT_0023160261 /DNA_START=181 /DNA_END=1890 /DNA_ORIENTATION=-